MSPVAGNILVDLRRFHLLEPEQFDELTRTLKQFPSEPKALAQELMRRGWLTPYQVNRLLQGRGQELVLGSYILLERLGEGGMGAVFKARNWKLGRLAPSKSSARIAPSRRTPSSASSAKCERRHSCRTPTSSTPMTPTRWTARTSSPWSCSAAWTWAGRHLRPAAGGTSVRVHPSGALGLQHAHERGMVHRDIKPSNLLVTSDGVVKILDLGLARLASSGDGESSGALTQTNSLMGTPDYMAPEQARQSHTVDGRADLFSLGATMYFLLTGQPPFARIACSHDRGTALRGGGADRVAAAGHAASRGGGGAPAARQGCRGAVSDGGRAGGGAGEAAEGGSDG